MKSLNMRGGSGYEDRVEEIKRETVVLEPGDKGCTRGFLREFDGICHVNIKSPLHLYMWISHIIRESHMTIFIDQFTKLISDVLCQ